MSSEGDRIRVHIMPADQEVEFQQGDFAELAPNEWVASCPPHLVPKVGMVRLMRAEGGLYQPVIEAMPQLVRRKSWSLERYGCTFRTVRALALAGFVESVQPTPNSTAIVLESYFAHLRNTFRERPFWTTDRLRDYQAASRRVHLEPEEDEETAPEGQQTQLDLSTDPAPPKKAV